MSDTQLYFAVGVPSFLVVLALVTNVVQSNRLADKIDRVAEQLNGKIERLAEQQHKDALTLQGYMVPLHERMAIVETKQK